MAVGVARCGNSVRSFLFMVVLLESSGHCSYIIRAYPVLIFCKNITHGKWRRSSRSLSIP
ncbi:hypothetical protein COCCADRAFT_111257 [Bipolaris zeicola 26-R-13]|uniref:Secreted protein n=1 Tax=Cochliobolus carbonum (strain 26-R-13) TaxID=930089 RepID=W6XK64_COCC2|nr:uncharacterized protein COCCADRAFT_111257 [Bipolaris zeicola 26-R-13]EUC27612.1 hypothetical protein COCCADRAFT_111257 [Bipolaris zeicola 26-R-13]